jgi:hypothetical protein
VAQRFAAPVLSGAGIWCLHSTGKKAHPRHTPDAKTSYSGTMLAWTVPILEVI